MRGGPLPCVPPGIVRRVRRGGTVAVPRLSAAGCPTVRRGRRKVPVPPRTEHPGRNDFRLVETARPQETARDVYRFEVKVAAGKTAALTVTEERDVSQAVQLTNSGHDQMRWFISQPAVSTPRRPVPGKLPGVGCLLGRLGRPPGTFSLLSPPRRPIMGARGKAPRCGNSRGRGPKL